MKQSQQSHQARTKRLHHYKPGVTPAPWSPFVAPQPAEPSRPPDPQPAAPPVQTPPSVYRIGDKPIPFTVVTAVGPLPHHRRWLAECMASVRAQTLPAAEHILVDDGAHLEDMEGVRIVRPGRWTGQGCRNYGIAEVRTDWIVILNSDDLLLPGCLAQLSADVTYFKRHYGAVFYLRFPVLTSTGRDVPSGECFHKAVWRETGGYPERANPVDVMFLSKVLAEHHFVVVDGMGPHDGYYWFREHPEQFTPYAEVMA